MNQTHEVTVFAADGMPVTFEVTGNHTPESAKAHVLSLNKHLKADKPAEPVEAPAAQ